jgi:ubiquinone/menaquinone biosynthesis C-methylase UbiE
MEAQSIAGRTDGSGADLDSLRANLHAMWGSVAEGWGLHADFVDARAARLTERLLELSAPQPGERVLELACGAGGLGLAAARRVAPGGEVVISDVAPAMTAIAAARAREQGVDNVSVRELDLERIAEPDASYDVVLCREGLMLVPDPARATREIRRVLRPGGRFALAVWGPRDRNPWLGVVLDAVSAHTGTPVPPPGIPGPFALEDAGEVGSLLSGAGLADVAVAEHDVPLRAPSFEDWWTRTSALAGPLAKLLASLPEDATDRIRADAREASARYETADGLEFPGATLVASGRRP